MPRGRRRGGYRGPLWGYGSVPGAPERGWAPRRASGFAPWVRRGRGVGPRRGAWRWKGSGPDAWAAEYGWEYRGGGTRGGAGLRRPEPLPTRRLAGERWLAERRAGGLPRDQELRAGPPGRGWRVRRGPPRRFRPGPRRPE